MGVVSTRIEAVPARNAAQEEVQESSSKAEKHLLYSTIGSCESTADGGSLQRCRLYQINIRLLYMRYLYRQGL